MRKQLPAWLVLCIIALFAGLMLAGTNELTKDRIYQQGLIAANAAREKVMPEADEFEEIHGDDPDEDVDDCYKAIDDGELEGYVGQVTVKGYGGNIEVVAGVDANGVITGVSVGGSDFSETAGLGAKTKEPAFTDQFIGLTPPLRLKEDVDSVTGASISSGAVVAAVNRIADHIIEDELGLNEEKETPPVLEQRSITVKGFGGNVDVIVSFGTDGKIVDVDVAAPNETEGLGKLTQEDFFTDQFIGKSGKVDLSQNDIEAVSGATVTSKAVVDGVNDILSRGDVEIPMVQIAKAKGFMGEVEVRAIFNSKGQLVYLNVLAPDETEGLGKLAQEDDFTEQFLGKAGPFAYGDGIDAISGATITSNAVLEALNLLVPAGDEGQPVEPEPEAEPTVEPTVEPTIEPTVEPTVEPEAEPVAEPETPADALTAKAKGFMGEVEVTATLNDDGTIATLAIKAPGETEGLGLKAEESEFAQQFIGKSAPFAYGDGIDAITGATMTSNAVLEALNSLFPADEPEHAEINLPMGHGPQIPTEPEAEPTVEPTADAEAPATDALTAKAKGFMGEVEVTATLNDDGTIATLAIKAPGETEGLGLKAEEPEFAEQFIGKSAPFAYGDGIDAITGATMTSNAVLEALNGLFPADEQEHAEIDLPMGHGPQIPAEPEAEPTVEPTAEAEAPADALTAKVKGFLGEVEVTASLNDDGTIATLAIKAPGETEGLGLKAEESEFAQQFIGKSAPFAYGDGIDAITGATMTSNAVLEALNSLFTE